MHATTELMRHETQLINVRGGFMTYTKHFKYLGSHISYSLQGDYDIKSRIAHAAATKAFGALTKFWYNRHVDVTSHLRTAPVCKWF